MKQVTIKLPLSNRFVHVDGWLFNFAGLRLVAHKDHLQHKWWKVSEFSTGLNLPCQRCHVNTRTAKIAEAIKCLTQMTSAYICEAVQVGIDTVGIINN